MSRIAETAVLCLSDLHYGAETRSYNPDIAKARLALVGDKMIAIRRQLTPTVAFDKLVVLLMGDIVDGAGIYETQAHHQAITNPEQQAREAADVLAEFLIAQKAEWGSVDVYTVAGNHGRMGMAMHESASHDVSCYRLVNLLVAKHGINVWISNRDPFKTVVRVRGHGVLVHHGHFVKAGDVPIPAILRRLVKWSLAESVPDFTLACLGHFHSIGYWRHNRLKLLLSGTPKTDDEWALDKLGQEPAANWWFFGVSDHHIPTWQFALELDDRRARVDASAVAPPEPPPVVRLFDGPPERIHQQLSPSAGVSVQAGAEPKPAGKFSAHFQRPCGKCQQQFTATFSRQVTCAQCRTKTCPVCGTVWTQKKWTAGRFCSLKCANANRQR